MVKGEFTGVTAGIDTGDYTQVLELPTEKLNPSTFGEYLTVYYELKVTALYGSAWGKDP